MKNTLSRFLPVLIFTSLLASTLWAQQPVRRCATFEYNKQKEQSNPVNAEAWQRYNQLLQQRLNEQSQGNERAVVTIPVVVHVIYKVNIQNISDAQIHSQIDVLNQDYGRTNADTTLTPAAFDSVAANTGIQFCLATQDPNGNPTTGIERRQNTSVSTWSNNEEMKSFVTGGLDAWDRNRYLNIWVCTLANPFLGFTQMAGNPDSLNDGVVVTSRAFGNTGYVTPPFHLGRTTTHEVGHWLGLIHIWGDDSGACSGDDNISDTRLQASETTGCPVFPVLDTCSPVYPGIMFMNYMDYTDDACMNMFTNGQAVAMNTAIAVFRPGILLSNGCGPVGINEIINQNDISVYPNPANGELYVTSNMLYEKSVIEICDVVGQRVIQLQTSNLKPQTAIDVSSLEAGTYFLKITSSNSIRTARFNIAR
jgi:hypothetical protein